MSNNNIMSISLGEFEEEVSIELFENGYVTISTGKKVKDDECFPRIYARVSLELLESAIVIMNNSKDIAGKFKKDNRG